MDKEQAWNTPGPSNKEIQHFQPLSNSIQTPKQQLGVAGKINSDEDNWVYPNLGIDTGRVIGDTKESLSANPIRRYLVDTQLN